MRSDIAPEDRRRFPRLNTGPEYGVRPVYQGRVLGNAQLRNISACGCGVQIQVEDVPGLEVGSVFEGIYLIHSDLPFLPLPALVMWVLGKHSNKTVGSITVGLDFKPITPFVQDLIQQHVCAGQ